MTTQTTTTRELPTIEPSFLSNLYDGVCTEASNHPYAIGILGTLGAMIAVPAIGGPAAVVGGIAQILIPLILPGTAAGGVYFTGKYVVQRGPKLLFGGAAEEVLELQESLQNYFADPNAENIEAVREGLTLLSTKPTLFRELVPNPSAKEIELCNATLKMLNSSDLNSEEAITQFRQFDKFLGAQVRCQEGYFWQWANNATETAPCLLTQLLPEMTALKQAIIIRDWQSFEESAKKNVPLLEGLIKDHSFILTKQPLGDTDLQLFQELLDYLRRDCGDNPGALNAMSPIVNKSLRTLTLYYNKHAGPFEKVGNFFIKKVNAKAGPTLKEYTDKYREYSGKYEEVRDQIYEFLDVQPEASEPGEHPQIEDVTDDDGKGHRHPTPKPSTRANGPQAKNGTPLTPVKGGTQQPSTAKNRTPTPKATPVKGGTQQRSVKRARPSPAAAQRGQPVETSATGPLGDLLSKGQGLLNSLLTWGGNAIADKATSSLARLVLWTFEKIRGYIERDETQEHLLSIIDPLIERLQTGSFEELKGVLEEAFDFIRENQVYFQGLRLPLSPVRTHASAIPNFLSNINAHQNALRHRLPQQVTPAMIEKQVEFLKIRSAAYGPAKFIAEKICGLEGSAAFYAEIFRPSSDSTAADLNAAFRDRLFAKIDASNLGTLRKWIAKRLYDLLHPLSTFYVHSIIGSSIKKIRDWIAAPAGAGESKDEFLIKLLRNWMAVTSSALNQVADAPPQQGKDFKAMVEEALKNPERNGGLTQEELFAAAIKTALDTFGPKIQWSETITDYLNTEIPSTSGFSFLNPALKVINTISSYCLRAVIFVPQWLGNQILQAGAKFALSHTSFLKDYSDRTIESLRRNTPSSYAMHRMIFRQQQKILTLLQENLNEDAPIASRNSSIKKVEIEALVKYALEFLNKSPYGTQDSLRNYLNGRAPLRNRAMMELEDTFIPEAMDTVVRTISIAMEAVTKEEEMQQMLYDGLQIANDAFDNEQPVSDAEFGALERGIRELTDQILETAIYHAIGEKFDFTNAKQKEGITQFFDTLKVQTGNFASKLSRKAGWIANSSSVFPADLENKISTMVETSSKYNRERVDALGRAVGNRNFHSTTKSELNTLSLELDKQCTSVANLLNKMKGLSDEMVISDDCHQTLLLCGQIQRSLREKLHENALSSADLDFYKGQISELKIHLKTLRRNQCPPQLAADIESCISEFTTAMNDICPLQKANGILLQAQSLFLKLKNIKIAEIASPHPSPQLQSTEKQLCELLDTLPISDQIAQLKTQLLHPFMLAVRSEEINALANEFSNCNLRLRVGNNNQLNNHLQTLKGTEESLRGKLTTRFARSNVRKTEDIKKYAAEVIEKVNAIDQWAKDQREPEIINLFAFDMDWLTETIKNVAFDRAKEKVQLLFDALYQRHNYVGLVNQVALLPFVESFGKHYLKK